MTTPTFPLRRRDGDGFGSNHRHCPILSLAERVPLVSAITQSIPTGLAPLLCDRSDHITCNLGRS